MTFPSTFHMPGAWNSEGVHPGLFRPPVSPSPTTDYLSTSGFSREANSKRRWSRGGVLQIHEVQPPTTDCFFDGDPFFGRPSAAPESTPYALAGRLNTPTAGHGMDGSGLLGESMFSDYDYRRALGTKRSRDQMEASTTGPTQLFQLPSKPTPAGWGSLALSSIGGVVGRVWEFCRSGAFRGFTAGGGVSFKMAPPYSGPLPTPPAEEKSSSQVGNPWHSEPATTFQAGRLHPEMPVYPEIPVYPEVPAYPEIPETVTGSGCSTPAAKRRHTEYLHELGRNWVMIREPSEGRDKRRPRKTSSSHRAPSPARSQASPATGATRRFATPNARYSTPVLVSCTPSRPASRPASSRPVSRLSDAGGSVRATRPASAASFASFTGRPVPTPSKIPVRTPTAAVSMAGPTSSPALVVGSGATPTHSNSRRRRNTALPAPSQSSPRGHRRSNSAVSASASASVAPHRVKELEGSSRLDDEAKELATRRKMEEHEADVRMTAFNRRLQDMIRQGKEALGTTVEVDMMEEEAFGWEDA